MTLTLDLIAHLDAGDKTKWQGDQNERPLSELGRRQAQALGEALGAEPFDALYSSPALRCRQSLEPLAERLGLTIAVLSGLGETDAWRVPGGWESGPPVAAYAAGRALAALEQVRGKHSGGRVVACSHGHIIPALVAFLIGAHELGQVPQLAHRGQWYRLRFEADRVGVELRETQPGFPE